MIPTTAYGVSEKIELASYVKGCVDYSLEEACKDESNTSGFFRIARCFRGVRDLCPDFGQTVLICNRIL
jgi:hypothetical protein